MLSYPRAELPSSEARSVGEQQRRGAEGRAPGGEKGLVQITLEHPLRSPRRVPPGLEHSAAAAPARQRKKSPCWAHAAADQRRAQYGLKETTDTDMARADPYLPFHLQFTGTPAFTEWSDKQNQSHHWKKKNIFPK